MTFDPRGVLNTYLRAQRHHVLGILNGLDEEAMHAAVLPSGWTPVGLVRHLTLDVERFWFGEIVLGESRAMDAPKLCDAWHVARDVPAADVLDLYRQQIERSDVIIATTSLATPPVGDAETLLGWQPRDLSDVLLHVIVETACHAGHLDAVVEMLSGRQWIVNTEPAQLVESGPGTS